MTELLRKGLKNRTANEERVKTHERFYEEVRQEYERKKIEAQRAKALKTKRRTC